MTKGEFLAAYAERSGRTVEWLLEFKRDYVVLPCGCDYEHCEGWAWVRNDPLDIWLHTREGPMPAASASAVQVPD